MTAARLLCFYGQVQVQAMAVQLDRHATYMTASLSASVVNQAEAPVRTAPPSGHKIRLLAGMTDDFASRGLIRVNPMHWHGQQSHGNFQIAPHAFLCMNPRRK